MLTTGEKLARAEARRVAAEVAREERIDAILAAAPAPSRALVDRVTELLNGGAE
jgi:hypothetical protein